MLHNILLVAGQVLTLFLLMAVGFALVKLGMLTEVGRSQMTSLLMYAVTPCVILNAFLSGDQPGPRALAVGMGAMAVHYLLTMPLVQLLYRREEPHPRSVLRFGLVYGNTGFMGLPLLEAVLGPESLFYGAIAVALMNITSWTHGIAVMGGKISPKKVLINPGVLPFLAAVALYLARFRLPGPLASAVGFMANLNTPLAMVIIGGQMASVDLLSTFTRPRFYFHAALKLLAAPLLTLLVLLPFRPDPLLYCAAVIIAATPTAGVTGIFAQKFGRAPDLAAQLITLSTLLSILTLPLFAAAARVLSGF